MGKKREKEEHIHVVCMCLNILRNRLETQSDSHTQRERECEARREGGDVKGREREDECASHAVPFSVNRLSPFSKNAEYA